MGGGVQCAGGMGGWVWGEVEIHLLRRATK